VCSKYKHVCPEGTMLLASGDMLNLKLKSDFITVHKLPEQWDWCCGVARVLETTILVLLLLLVLFFITVIYYSDQLYISFHLFRVLGSLYMIYDMSACVVIFI
jgi:hypothetical protein